MLQAELYVMSGKQAGTVIPLPGGKFLIGREEDCHLRPNSDLVSRHHCVFTIDDFTVRLRDLGSTNGTLVNGERIRGGVVLNSGDVVSVGKVELRVIIQDPAQDTVSNLALDSETQFVNPAETSIPLAQAAAPSAAAPEGSSIEIPTVTETIADLPLPSVAASSPFMAPPTGDTQFAAPMGMPMPTNLGYPQLGYPQMMPYGFPGYPQMYGQPMGYPMPQGYPQMGVPTMPPPPVEAPPEPAAAAPAMAVKLPDPSETGAKAPAPKPAAPATGEGQTAEAKSKEEAPRRAEDIIQQYLKRRPTGDDKGKKK